MELCGAFDRGADELRAAELAQEGRKAYVIPLSNAHTPYGALGYVDGAEELVEEFTAIYESGVTEDGQHFFAMELVGGETLDRYLEKRPPVTTSQELRFRLELFAS